jgi:hypothetical protein
MEKLFSIIIALFVIAGIYFMGTYITAERSCYAINRTGMDDAEVRLHTLNYSQEQYCRMTYQFIEELDQCMKKTDTMLPPGLQFVKKFVDDFETVSQYRSKSLPALKVDHDQVCSVYPDFRYSEPE